MTSTHLHHMLHHHGRTRRDLDGLPLAVLHRLEHVEQVLDLIALDHRHSDEELARDSGPVPPHRGPAASPNPTPDPAPTGVPSIRG